MIDYNKILAEICNEIFEFRNEGTVASYIPELRGVSPDKFGIHLVTIQGDEFATGDSNEKFSIQSISKLFSLSMAISSVGDDIWNRMGVEPSGNAFNSIVQLEYEKGKPRNPFINAGAIVVADILLSCLANPEEEFLDFVRELSANDQLNFNQQVADSEFKTGFLNASLVNLMKSFGNIQNDIERVLSFYYKQCSLEMSCRDISNALLPFAYRKSVFEFNNVVLSQSQVKRINAIMQTCGLYDESGDFSYRVGLPGKSGVGGGITAIYPDKYAVTVWSPRLNAKGNSVLGMKSLELLTTKTGQSVF